MFHESEDFKLFGLKSFLVWDINLRTKAISVLRMP